MFKWCAQVVVTVANKLLQKAITIHWHGILQEYTYFMDGAESVTQCPILPGQSFTYRFKAHPVGTHWYHAHMASMRLDGMFGILIIHATPPKIPYFSISVNDWSHITSEEIEVMDVDVCENGAVGPSYEIPDVTIKDCSFEGAELDRVMYTSSLFDGRNRWQDQPFPLKFYVVKTGQRYRFRVVNAGHIFPFQIQVDGHPITVVASDGAEIEPIAVDSFFISVAESIDFEIDANQTPGRYWIRAETQCPGAFARGILAYEGFEGDPKDPISQPKECTQDTPCRVFNCPFGRYPDGSNRTCIAMADARSTMSSHDLAERFGVGSRKVVQLFMNFGMVAGSSINGRRFKMPAVPLFHDVTTESDCFGRPCLDGCNCRCSKIITLPYGQTVRLIVSNLQPDRNVTQNMYVISIRTTVCLSVCLSLSLSLSLYACLNKIIIVTILNRTIKLYEKQRLAFLKTFRFIFWYFLTLHDGEQYTLYVKHKRTRILKHLIKFKITKKVKLAVHQITSIQYHWLEPTIVWL